jgi:FMN phosphatase YigB (HAD superfamily)
MLRSLYPDVDWDAVRIVGLDLDGTLYDEADFIAQVYEPIAAILSDATGVERESLYPRLLRRWLEKGSSYDRIFREALDDAGVGEAVARDAVAKCVDAFRSFSPSLTLPTRARTILDALYEMFPLFLVSDGSAGLQQRKFEALGLQRWFEPRNVAISGRHGAEYCKPGIRMLSEIALLRGAESFAHVVYFGDRDIDAQFAEQAGFQFVQVACMR